MKNERVWACSWCSNMTSIASSMLVDVCFRREAKREQSQISVLTCACVGSVWGFRAGLLPVVSAHTVKSYERCESPCGYHHFSNAWIIQSKSIPIDLPGAEMWNKGRNKWCNLTIKTPLWEISFSEWNSEWKIHCIPESLCPLISIPWLNWILKVQMAQITKKKYP